jgi:heme exporter protein D
MDLGTHASFIWAAYAVTALVIAALFGWLLADGQRQRAALKDLDARGIKRRSAQGSSERAP